MFKIERKSFFVHEKFLIFIIFWLIIFEISKKEKSKTIIARGKTRTDLESALISAQVYEALFSIFVFFLMIKDFPTEMYFFPKMLIF